MPPSSCCECSFTAENIIDREKRGEKLEKAKSRLLPLINVVAGLYAISSDRWLVSNNETITQGLIYSCGAGNEVNCAVTGGNCTVCVDQGHENDCIDLEQDTDEILVFRLLVASIALRIIAEIVYLSMDCFCEINKCCGCKNPHDNTMEVVKFIADIIDLTAASVYTAYNEGTKLDAAVQGKSLCGRFGVPFIISWVKGAQAPMKILGSICKTCFCGGDDGGGDRATSTGVQGPAVNEERETASV